jgi:hypothetical protein
MTINVNNQTYYLNPANNSILNCNKKALTKAEKEELLKNIDCKIVSKFKFVVHLNNLRRQAIKNFKNLETSTVSNTLKKAN